jgi:hypothetical protein
VRGTVTEYYCVFYEGMYSGICRGTDSEYSCDVRF